MSDSVWPSFFSSEATRQPGASVGTMKAEMPFLPASGSVTAKTMATSAVLPDVMNCFTPFSTQPALVRTARVFRAEASEPACGSVRAKAPSFSPRAMGRSHWSFWASVP